jgi:catechol 2,3-dioxygenase-like lactoylglutathione lyase family enzyme
MGIGSPPADGFAPCCVEIMVTDFDRSCSFWTGVLQFEVAYLRPAQKFAYLQHADGAQMMLYQRDGDWETGGMEVPFGRGAVIQIAVADVDVLAVHVAAQGVPFYVAPREKWRDWGDRMGGQREFLLQDPDGYLVMVLQRIGTRPMGVV